MSTFHDYAAAKLLADKYGLLAGKYGRWCELPPDLFEGLCQRFSELAQEFYPDKKEFEDLQEAYNLQADDLSNTEQRLVCIQEQIISAVKILRP